MSKEEGEQLVNHYKTPVPVSEMKAFGKVSQHLSPEPRSQAKLT